MIEAGDAEKLRGVLVKLQASAPAKAGMPLATIELSSLGWQPVGGQSRSASCCGASRIVAVVRKQDRLPVGLRAGPARRDHRCAPTAAYPADCNVEVGGKVAFHNFFLDRSALRGLHA
jgi:hypothetical protein